MRPSTKSATPSRRSVLTGMGAVAATMAGCDMLSTEPTARGREESNQPKGKEAPDLARAVEAGDLPKLSERLPESPLVVEPVDRIGTYGGRWPSALVGPSQGAYIYCLTGYENLVRWSIEWRGEPGLEAVQPNVAETFEVNDDGREYTFTLRQGMKWSDGAPFTADDVLFAVDDVLLSTEVYPVPPNLLRDGQGNPAEIEKLDEYSFRITFRRPNSLFLRMLATPDGHVLTHFPRHYHEEFHATYNSEIDQLVEQEGHAEWIELFGAKGGAWNWGNNPEQPTLAAWMLVTPFGEGTSVRLERNPYYWKVDPEGSQLPYLDDVVFEIVADPEVMQLRASSGEIDLEAGPDTRFTSLTNKPVLAQNREQGNYRFIDVDDTRCNVMVIHLNQNHKNPALREVFANRDFRIGLSHAIDRDELVKVTLQRQGEAYQMAPVPNSTYYNEELATQYLEYDVDRANEYLDRAGYSERDSDGIRLGPDGEPISFHVAIATEFRQEWTEMLNLISEYWRAVGVDMSVENMERTLWGERQANNDHDASVWQGEGGMDVALNLAYYAPTTRGALYGALWGAWYETRGDEGEEPPEMALRQLELYDEVRETVDGTEQKALLDEVLQIARDEFYVIGTARELQKYFVASNDFHNVPDPMIQGWEYPTPGPTQPCQYFIGSP